MNALKKQEISFKTRKIFRFLFQKEIYFATEGNACKFKNLGMLCPVVLLGIHRVGLPAKAVAEGACLVFLAKTDAGDAFGSRVNASLVYFGRGGPNFPSLCHRAVGSWHGINLSFNISMSYTGIKLRTLIKFSKITNLGLGEN